MASRALQGITRRGRTIGAGLVVAGLLVAGGCSSDGGSDDAAPERTTTSSPAETTTSTTEAEATTTSAAEPAATTTTAAPTPPGEGPTDYAGTVDGQEDASVSFTRDGATVTGFEAEDLGIECQPLDNTGDATSRTVSVEIDEAPVATDLTVTFTDEDEDLSPSLSGGFAADGSFTGGLFLTGEDDGYVCGAELTFRAAPA